ncbi:MAG TPA: ABC transporter permease [Myxococcaceae bacterium]|nr:ABC transporter permease [Myxococcaceae bacterium]
MTQLETIRVAVRALLRNKLRSFLTTLGMIFGVGAVVATVAIGEGARSAVEEAFASMGTNLLVVLPGSSSTGGARGGFGSQPTLTWEDLRAIRAEVPTVRYAVPYLRSSSQVLSDEQNWTTQVAGTEPDYFEVRSWPMALGTRFTDSDVDTGTKVVVLGATVADKLFGPSSNPVGQTVRIRNIPFQVTAVAARKGQTPTGQDSDDVVFIPRTTFQSKIQGGLGKFLQGTIFISATDAVAAERQVADLLRDRHRIGGPTEDDFQIRNLAEVASAQEESSRTVTLFLAIVAAVSLLVGGIGIMNIMLVSVTERTREIGLRMAVGARPLDIMLQFLCESLTLSAGGGLVGVGLGLLCSARLTAWLGFPSLLRPDAIFLALGVSAAVGVGFGSYPAWRAAALDPIEAMRFES